MVIHIYIYCISCIAILGSRPGLLLTNAKHGHIHTLPAASTVKSLPVHLNFQPQHLQDVMSSTNKLLSYSYQLLWLQVILEWFDTCQPIRKAEYKPDLWQAHIRNADLVGLHSRNLPDTLSQSTGLSFSLSPLFLLPNHFIHSFPFPFLSPSMIGDFQIACEFHHNSSFSSCLPSKHTCHHQQHTLTCHQNLPFNRTIEGKQFWGEKNQQRSFLFAKKGEIFIEASWCG